MNQFSLAKPGFSFITLSGLKHCSSSMSITFLCLQLLFESPNDSGLRYFVSGFFFPYSFKSLIDGFHRIHVLKKRRLRLLCVSVGMKWKLVLKSNHTLKKPSMQWKFLLTLHVKALGPHVRIWALVLFVSFSSHVNDVSQ